MTSNNNNKKNDDERGWSFAHLSINRSISITCILFIYLVLASLYGSFITPFTIMLVLPLAICEAFFAPDLTGASLDLFSLIGYVIRGCDQELHHRG